MVRRAGLVLFLLAAVVAAGCGAVGLERPEPLAARIVMTESGGIAGMVNVLTVETNLNATYQTRQGTRSGKISAQSMAALAAAFYDNGFFAMKADYRPQPMIADGITTTIDYRDALRSKTVSTGTNANAPAALNTIERELKSLITEIGR